MQLIFTLHPQRLKSSNTAKFTSHLNWWTAS